ncbi:MAG: aquaporin family protein [Alphaproteobacteria bacterium]|nr:aquaporin family protein [Alphaproteobacteria bacterium]
MRIDLARRLAAEALGTSLLLITVVGSGIMAERLAGGNLAVALLANSLATGAALVVLITVFGPLSGAHFNPCVSLYFALQRAITLPMALAYSVTQTVAAIAGVWLAHVMFGMPVLETSTHIRSGLPLMLAEFIATFGLFATIAGGVRFTPSSVPMLVCLYITSAYWFTASTSFANPAVTLARALTDSFAGIAPASVPGFLTAQLLGAIAGWVFFRWLFAPQPA